MTDALPQPPLDLDPLNGHPGPVTASLARSVAAARAAGRIAPLDEAAIGAATAIARSLDEAIGYGATLETVIKGTTALRAYLAALNLTPASRDEDGFSVDHGDPDTPDWVAGAATVSHTTD